MRILTVPQDTAMLRTKSFPISLTSALSTSFIAFLKDLGETLKSQRDPQGVGLSAIQVGHPIRVFATFLPSASKGPTLPQGRTLSDATNELRFYINPEIVDHSLDTTLGEDLIQQSEKRKAKSEKDSLDSSSLAPSLPPKPFLEGCLSIPKIYGPVPRWKWIKVRASILSESDLSSPIPYPLNPKPFALDTLAARVFQHELDHLDGILFTDRTVDAGLQLYESREKELVPMEM